MERIVRIVTKNLIQKLPSEKKFFRLDELETLEIPEFIVDRIEVELERKLSDSIIPPNTEWADMKSRNVQKAWQNFADAIRSESRLPYDYLPDVIETAVSDTLDILIQPRKAIPAILFGADKALDRKSLEERAKSVVVYKHLAQAPVRYIYRKDLQALTLEQCTHIVSTVDEKLVSRYNALNWAHLLEPLFVLLGDTIDTNLLRIFFQDKKRPRISQKFERMNSSISRTGLIKMLSDADLVENKEVDHLQSALFEGEDKPLQAIRDIKIDPDLNVPPPAGKNEEDSEKDDVIPLNSRFIYDESVINERYTEEEKENEEDDSETSRYSFNSMFIETEEENAEAEDAIPVRKSYLENNPGDDEPGLNRFDENHHIDHEDDIFPEAGRENEGIAEGALLNETDPPEQEKQETYIWQHFLNKVDEETEIEAEAQSEIEEEEESKEFGGIDNKSFEKLSFEISKDLENLSKADELRKWLGDDVERIITELFDGSVSDFENAIHEIAGFEEWKPATRYIEKEIFARNHIDMYDDVAVDFTDKLHNYFTERKPYQPGS